MRVAHLIATLARESGGPAQACADMARAVARRGHDVTVLTTTFGLETESAGAARSEPLGDGARVVFFPVHWPRFWKPSFAMARGLSTMITDFDVVHMHSLYLFHNWAGGRACRRAGTPYILRPHGTLDPYIHRRHRWRKAVMEALFQNQVTRDASAIHFTSEDERRLAAPYVFGRPGIVTTLGVDRFEPPAQQDDDRLRRRFPEIGDRPIVLFLGRLNFKKGLEILVEAFDRAVRGGRDLHLLLAGPDDGMEADIWSLVSARSLQDRVTFAGMLTGVDKSAALAQSAVFVLPSFSENFGIACAEALAAGLPVIVSRHVNIASDIAGAEAGFVTEAEVGSVASAIERFFDLPDGAADEMGRRGVELARARYDWDAIAARLEAMYQAVAERDAGAIHTLTQTGTTAA